MNDNLGYYATRIKQVFKMESRSALFALYGMLHETVTISTKQGLLTVSTKDRIIGACLYRDKQFEFDSSIRTIMFLKKSGYIPKTKVSMLDVGANIGHISIGLLLADQVDLAVAIEPVGCNFELLRKNVEQNGLSKQMFCLQAAVGDKASTLTMELSPINAGDHRIRSTTAPGASEKMHESERQTVQVQSITLPQVMERREVHELGLSMPSFVWIDVQGYEGYIFKGGESMLAQGIPTVSEIWPYGILRSGMSLEEYTNILSSIWSDYWVERRDRFTRYPISVFDRYLEEIGTYQGYHENVIFTKNRT